MEPEADAAERMELIFEALEALSGLRVTAHDCSGFFCSPEGKPLLKEKRCFHDIPFCLAPREGCRDNDWLKGNRAAAKANAPSLWRCWRGPCQILIPLKLHGRHLGTLFLGPFRVAGEPLRDWREESLPVRELSFFERGSALYACLAEGLVQLFKNSLGHGAKGARWAKIFAFVSNNSQRGTGIKDLAKELKLSPSRASHVVKRSFGMPFEKLLLEHRLQRAAALLENTEKSLSQIAAELGFCDLYYFSKQFKRGYGLPPGKFRAQARLKPKGRI